MLTRWFATREPLVPASAGKLRRSVATALVAASLLLGGALAPLAGAAPTGATRHSAPVSDGRVHPFPECPGVQIGC